MSKLPSANGSAHMSTLWSTCLPEMSAVSYFPNIAGNRLAKQGSGAKWSTLMPRKSRSFASVCNTIHTTRCLSREPQPPQTAWRRTFSLAEFRNGPLYPHRGHSNCSWFGCNTRITWDFTATSANRPNEPKWGNFNTRFSLPIRGFQPEITSGPNDAPTTSAPPATIPACGEQGATRKDSPSRRTSTTSAAFEAFPPAREQALQPVL